jgi:hypothetical protein
MENNGTHASTTNGTAITPEDFEHMVDASEKPPKAAKEKAGKVKPAASVAPPPAIPLEAIQAAREEIYVRSTVPEPLKPIFNRLPPEEIIFVIAHVEHAYRSGMSAAVVDPATAQRYGMMEKDLEKFSSIIADLSKAVSLLEGDEPNVRGCLRMADRAFQRLQTP